MIHNEKEFRLKAQKPIEKFLRTIHDYNFNGELHQSKDRGSRAALRRAGTAISALTEPTVHLIEGLNSTGVIDSENATEFALTATLAALLASLTGAFEANKDSAPLRSLAKLAGDKNGRNSPCLSNLRFGKLTKANTPEKRLKAFRELVEVTKAKDFKQIDPIRLAYLYLNWDSPSCQWFFARDYFLEGTNEPEQENDESDHPPITSVAEQ
jgi:CRISPR type I-E-associated protein CasB/Cse2